MDNCLEASSSTTCIKCNPLYDGGMITITSSDANYNKGTFCVPNNQAGLILRCDLYKTDDKTICQTCNSNYPANGPGTCLNVKDPGYLC